MVTVQQLLNRKGVDVIAIAPNATVREALTLMAQKEVGALLVMENDELVGIITERDYARKVILMGRTSKDTTVGEIMSSKLVTVTPEHKVKQCMEMMTGRRIRHLPVLNDGKLVGLISIGDVVKSVIASQANMIEHLESYIYQ